MQDPASQGRVVKLNVRLLEDIDESGEQQWQFEPGPTIEIGRASSSDIQLRHALVSKRHASLTYKANSWICTSFGTNGVFHLQKPIDSLAVKDGVVLRFAATGPRLHFQLVSEVEHESVKVERQEALDWIEGLANGDSDSATSLWEEYFERVVKLARGRIANNRQRRVTDEEDVAVSVLQSICAGMQAGKFPDLKDSDSLWRLLCVMTKRRVIRYANHEQRQKRGGGQIRGESVFGGAGGDSNAFGIEAIGGNGSDGFGHQLLEQTEWLMETLGDEELRRITELKLAEYTNDEIANELGCNVRTVKRRLQTIRSILGDAMSVEDC